MNKLNLKLLQKKILYMMTINDVQKIETQMVENANETLLNIERDT